MKIVRNYLSLLQLAPQKTHEKIQNIKKICRCNKKNSPILQEYKNKK